MQTGTVQPFETELFRKDGTRVPVLVAGALFEEGGNEGVVFALDLSEQKRAEEALRERENYLAESQRLTHTGSWAIDGTTHEAQYWSEEMFRIFGFDPQQGFPKRDQWLQRIHPEDRDKVKRQASDRMFLQKVDSDVEYRIVLPDGTVKHIHGLAHPVLSPNGELVQVVGTMVDITERKHAEEARDRLRQLEADLAHINRVSTMGEMAASLAHEIKQPISAATTNAQISLWLLERDQLEIQELREAISAVMQSVKRAADIIDHVRSLSKKGTQDRVLVDLNQVIREIEPLLEYESRPSSVAIRLNLSEHIPQVSGDRVQLQQVVMNLMLNAIEAMKDSGGELVVTSEQTDSGQVLISLSDTGVGLPDNKEDRIFEAFFSTKPQGTGMGLAISRSIVESHGGRLWAKGNPERGATFYFELPPHESEAA